MVKRKDETEQLDRILGLLTRLVNQESEANDDDLIPVLDARDEFIPTEDARSPTDRDYGENAARAYHRKRIVVGQPVSTRNNQKEAPRSGANDSLDAAKQFEAAVRAAGLAMRAQQIGKR